MEGNKSLIITWTGAVEECLPETLDWLITCNGAITQRGCSASMPDLAAVAACYPSPRIILLIPGRHCLITALNAPPARRQQLEALAPNLLEEWLSSDVEDLHVVPGTRNANGKLWVVAIDRKWLENILAAFSTYGLVVPEVYVDAQLIPVDDGAISVLAQGDRLLLHWSSGAGAVDQRHAGEFIDALLRDQEPAAIRRLMPDGVLQLDLDEWRQNIESRSKTGDLASPDSLALLSSYIGQNRFSLINLRQGNFSANEPFREIVHRWRPVFLTISCCLVLQMLFNVGRGYYLEYQATQLHLEAEGLYRELFPQDRKLVNLRRQMEHHLSQQESHTQSSFLLSLRQLGTAIQSLNENGDIHLTNLTFDSASSSMSVDIVTKDLDQFNTFEQQLVKSGHRVHVSSISNGEDGVSAKLRMEDTH